MGISATSLKLIDFLLQMVRTFCMVVQSKTRKISKHEIKIPTKT
jgi:hypothetical protein